MTRVMVDMSATIVHYGHIRLLKKAKEFGDVLVVSLSTDKTVLEAKGYMPELSYEERKEIISAIKYVDEVVSIDKWVIDDKYLEEHNIDILVHGDDNENQIDPNKLKMFPRTEGISTSDLRQRVLNCMIEQNLNKNSKEGGQKFAKTIIDLMSSKFKLD